jgi:hypothetical protein
MRLAPSRRLSAAGGASPLLNRRRQMHFQLRKANSSKASQENSRDVAGRFVWAIGVSQNCRLNSCGPLRVLEFGETLKGNSITWEPALRRAAKY